MSFVLVKMDYTSQHLAVQYLDQTICYSSLFSKANQLAIQLRNYVKPQEVVIQIVPKGIEMIIGIIAIAMCRGIYCPYHFKDPKERLQQIQQITQNPIILTTSKIEPKIRDIRDTHILCIDTILNDTISKEESSIMFKDYLQLTDLVYLISTSGSTGLPKLVSIEWKSVLNLCEGMIQRIGWNAESRVLQLSRCSFDAQVSEIYATLLIGGTIIMPIEDWNYSLSLLVDQIQASKVTSIFMVPSLVPSLQKITKQPMESVTSIIIGGEAVYPSIIQSLEYLFPHAVIHVAYGPTETCVYASFLNTKEYHGQDKWAPIGYPLPGYYYKVNIDAALDNRDSVEGELWIGGEGVMRSYYNNVEQTDRAIVIDSNNKRWYKTGDLVYQDKKGCMHFVGRKDFQVKFNGQRLELGEIESHLQGLSGVERSVLLKKIVNNQEALVGYIQTQSIELDSRTCRSYLSSKVPSYMVPLHWVFMPEFPLTSSGKIDRKQLPEPVLSLF